MISANKLFCLLLKSPEKWRPFLPNVSMFINLTEIVRDPLWGSLLHKSDPWFGNWSEYYYTSTILFFMTRGLLMDGPISEIWLAILIFYLQSKITLAGRIDSSPHRSNNRNWTIGKKKCYQCLRYTGWNKAKNYSKKWRSCTSELRRDSIK